MPRLVDQKLMEESVARVLSGEKALTVSKEASIPYSTLMRYVSRRRPPPVARTVVYVPQASPSSKPKPSTDASHSSSSSSSSEPSSMPYTIEAEQFVFEWMKREQAAGRRLTRQLVLAKAAEALGWRHGVPAALANWWFRRFRHRRPEVLGPASKLSVVLDAAVRREDAGESAVATAPVDEQCAACVASTAALDAVDRAVRLVQAEYAHKLEPDEMADAFHAVVDPFRARGFSSMAPGAARDAWLTKQIRQLQSGREARGGSDPLRALP